jgi:hypothetical protein
MNNKINILMMYLPIISLLISIVSMIIAYISLKRTKIFQEYEYIPRLQITDEQIMYGTEELPNIPALSYSSKIENRGAKPVKIDTVYLDYGENADPKKRMKYSVEGEIYLAAGQEHNIERNITWHQVEEMKKRYNINQAMFFLRVSYHKPGNKIKESLCALGGFDGRSRVKVVRRGDTLY